MKKSKLKTLVKSARKNTEKEIKITLTTGIKEIIAQHGELSKKVNKDIQKSAKYLSKKVAKEIKIDKIAIAKSGGAESSSETETQEQGTGSGKGNSKTSKA